MICHGPNRGVTSAKAKTNVISKELTPASLLKAIIIGMMILAEAVLETSSVKNIVKTIMPINNKISPDTPESTEM